MNAMKKILAFALAGVMALALLTGCGTGSSASHKSIAKAMADYDNGQHLKTTITCTSSAVLDAKLQEQAKKPGFEDVVKNVYKGTLTSFTIPSNSDLSGKVVYLYCGKYDKDAQRQGPSCTKKSPRVAPGGEVLRCVTAWGGGPMQPRQTGP